VDITSDPALYTFKNYWLLVLKLYGRQTDLIVKNEKMKDGR
jgi:hypothetical protein